MAGPRTSPASSRSTRARAGSPRTRLTRARARRPWTACHGAMSLHERGEPQGPHRLAAGVGVAALEDVAERGGREQRGRRDRDVEVVGRREGAQLADVRQRPLWVVPGQGGIGQAGQAVGAHERHVERPAPAVALGEHLDALVDAVAQDERHPEEEVGEGLPPVVTGAGPDVRPGPALDALQASGTDRRLQEADLGREARFPVRGGLSGLEGEPGRAGPVPGHQGHPARAQGEPAVVAQAGILQPAEPALDDRPPPVPELLTGVRPHQ